MIVMGKDSFRKVWNIYNPCRLELLADFNCESLRETKVSISKRHAGRADDPQRRCPIHRLYGSVTTATEYPLNFSMSLLTFIIAGGWKLVVSST